MQQFIKLIIIIIMIQIENGFLADNAPKNTITEQEGLSQPMLYILVMKDPPLLHSKQFPVVTTFHI